MPSSLSTVLDDLDAIDDVDAIGGGSASEPPRGSDFAQLSQKVTAAGLMRRRPGYYTAKIIATVGMFVAAWVAFALIGDSWWQLLVAAFLAFATTQVAFLGHDFAHRQIFRKRRASEFAGVLLGNLGIGMSYAWWVSKHTRHHANPNHADYDPDVAAGALVWTPEQAASYRGASRLLARWQGYLFFPLLFLEGLSLHVAGAKEILDRNAPMRHRGWEAALIVTNFVGYLAAVFFVLPPGMAFAFIAVHQGLFGFYMGCSFAPNHKGMPMPTAEDQLDFLRRQVLTSRNVTGGVAVDFLLGGLNYQIEHHLFPSMPRANLRRAQPIVRDFCAENGVAYLETGLISSYAQAVSYLDAIGRCTIRTAG